MRLPCLCLIFLAGFLSMASRSMAENATLEVTISYRERIALPPDAVLDVQLLDLSRADTASGRIAFQRFAMTAIPMTVELTYDPQIIDDQARYAVVAGIWSGEGQMFRTTRQYRVLDGPETATVDILLSMVAHDSSIASPPLSITGFRWSVTEIGAEPWANDDPATLVIDDEMNFSIFGGCNRLTGQLVLSDGEIAFPENFAGTLMACPDQVEARERRFLAALRDVSRYVRYRGGLVMTDAAGNALLHFEDRPE